MLHLFIIESPEVSLGIVIIFGIHRRPENQSRSKVIPVIISLAEPTNFMILNY